MTCLSAYMYRQISKYTDKHYNIEQNVCFMWASLENFGIFTFILKLLISFNIWSVHQILCRYKWHACRFTCTDKFPNVPTKLRKRIMGGGGGGVAPPTPPPPPSGYANVLDMLEFHAWEVKIFIWEGRKKKKIFFLHLLRNSFHRVAYFCHWTAEMWCTSSSYDVFTKRVT